jgi:hypothetical protein
MPPSAVLSAKRRLFRCVFSLSLVPVATGILPARGHSLDWRLRTKVFETRIWERIGAALLLVLCWMATASPALAATNRYVATNGNDQRGTNFCTNPSNPCATIQQGIFEAANGDIVNVAAGTYTENVVINANFIQNLTIQGSTTGITTVDGNKAGRVFELISAEPGPVLTMVFDHLTITNGNSSVGGGIAIGGGSGLAIWNVTVSNCVISGNSVTQTPGDGGGGIASIGNLTVINSTVSNNSVTPLTNQGGGGIENFGTLTIINTTISSNSTAGGSGGGIDNQGAMNVTNSAISGNSAGGTGGGGIINEKGSTGNVINSTISGNSAGGTGLGGAILNDGTLSLTNDTIAGNSAGTLNVGGIFNNGSPTITALNTIVASNGQNCEAPVVTLGHNLDSDGTCFHFGGTDLPNTDPKLGPFQNNGGPTFTMMLLAGSPALDAGDDAVLSPPYSLTTDQRGAPRKAVDPAVPNPHVDIGALEFQLSGLTTTALTSTLNSSSVGQVITFTATVTPPPAVELGPVSGTATFAEGSNVLATAAVVSGIATFPTSALNAGTHSITASYHGAGVFSSSTSPVFSQTVLPAPTVTVLDSSMNPSNVGDSVTYTARVGSGFGTPSGTVTFQDGGTTLATGTLDAGGNAGFTTSALTQGSHSITAAYAGGSAFAASTSLALTEIVEPVQIILSSSPGSQTVTAGASATYNLNVKAGGTLSGPVSFSCIGLPQSASCSFSPNSVNAGSTGTPVTLTVSTTARTSAALAPPFGRRFIYALALALPAVILLPATKRRRKPRTLLWRCWPLLLLVLCLAGCGGKSSVGNPGTPAGTYTLGIVSSAGSTQNVITVTLVVQ